MLDGMTALVTGASQGIGRTIAVELAAQGAAVALAARNEAGLRETAAACDGETLVVPMDVTDEAEVQAGIEACVDRFGGLDCLVNNAGVAGPTAGVEDIDHEAFRRVLAVNVEGPFLCTKHAAPHLRASDRGSMVVISSIGGKRPYPQRSPYAASKMAVIGLTRAYASELGPEVTVNAVCPGATEGERIQRVFEARAEGTDRTAEELMGEFILDDLPVPELVPAEEVAAMVAFLAGPHARHITAQDINVDSGGAWY